MPFTLTMPKLSPTMEEGMIATWHKKEGDRVEVDDVLFDVATDKATVEYQAIDEGWLRKIIVKDGQQAAVNQPIAIFTENQNESIEGYESPKEKNGAVAAPAPVTASAPSGASAPKAATAIPSPAQQPVQQGRILASPLAKKIAKDQNIDLSRIQGTGPGKRIMSRDLSMAAPASQPAVPAGTFVEEILTPMRKTIAKRLQESKATIPHFYVEMAVNAEELVKIREQLIKGDMKVSINDLIVKACALALRKHPVVNSGFNAANQSVIRYQTVDISVAVSVKGGLITPIVKHADFKNVREISAEVKALAARAKEGKLDPQEYQGGSFTISNLGMYGVTSFQAIINPPQAAILSVSAILDVPVVKNGAIVPGKVMNLTLSVDHRVVDGVAGAEFMKTLQTYLENPALLLI